MLEMNYGVIHRERTWNTLLEMSPTICAINNAVVITKHPGTSQTAILRTLRFEDGDSSENVAEKVNPRSFNLYRD